MLIQYLLLGQLLLQCFAVADGHCLDLLLPLLGVSDPLDEPGVALAVVAQLSAQLLQLPVAQVHLGEHGPPAVLQPGQVAVVVVQLHVALAVHTRHAVAGPRRLLQLSLQGFEGLLLRLGRRLQFL